MGVHGIHHVEIYVANTHQAAHFYRSVLGFHIVGTCSADAERPDRTTIAVEREDVRLLLTAPLTAASPVAEHIRLHGEGVKDVAFFVRDVDELFDRATARGARPLQPPSTSGRGGLPVRTACIGACGDLVHSLFSRQPERRAFVPGLVSASRDAPVPDTALEAIDHVALALKAGELDSWVEFYTTALGFEETHQEQVSTEYSAMRSKVVATPNGAVRFPLLEPAPGRRRSQIEAYVDSHEGPGAQHVAFRSRDIVTSVRAMAQGVEFLPTPSPYYESLAARVGALPDDIDALRRHGILVDRDPTGLLLQVFTRPIGPRPTLFLEVIERRDGARGFGSGNIKALFEAVERMQAIGDRA